MSYRVTAPLVLARDRDGTVHHRYYGTVINWLDDEQRDHFVESGLVEKIGAVEQPGDDKPAKTAPKPELIAWLVANVAKEDGSDYTADELNEFKVPELRDLVDSVE